MIKRPLLFLITLLWAAPAITLFALKPGDSLAILAKKVWAYTDPNDLSTRKGPFHYNGKQLLFLDEPRDFPRYFLVVTPEGDTAYSRKKNLSGDPALDRNQLKEDIRNETGAYAPGCIQQTFNTLINFRKWYTYVGLLVWVMLLYLFWKKFYLFDHMLNSFRKDPDGQTGTRWPLTWSAIAGLTVGITMLFNSKEMEWFFEEGIRVLAWYPSFWDYLWWLICLGFFILLVYMVMESIQLFGWMIGTIRSILLLIIMNLYVLTGLFTGWLIAILLIILLLIRLLSSGGGTPGKIKYKGVTYVKK